MSPARFAQKWANVPPDVLAVVVEPYLDALDAALEDWSLGQPARPPKRPVEPPTTPS